MHCIIKKIVSFVCIFFAILTNTMQEKPLRVDLLHELPKEIIDHIMNIQKSPMVYNFKSSEIWLLPQTLRTIDLKMPDLLFDTQFVYEAKWRLSSYKNQTHDHFCRIIGAWQSLGVFFDGINDHRCALVAETNKEEHKLYVLNQSHQPGGTFHKVSIYPSLYSAGWLTSLLLHRESNRCVRGIRNVGKHTDNTPHRIVISDICEPQGPYKPNLCETVATLETSFVLKKAVRVSNTTYLGLTGNHDMISFWLDDKNQLSYAKQTCPGKKFKDIDVDETFVTEKGFMPRVGLLTTTGEVYLTDFSRERPILRYITTLKAPDDIVRFFYDKQQCAVVYKSREQRYRTLHVWPDGFNLALTYSLLKKEQKS